MSKGLKIFLIIFIILLVTVIVIAIIRSKKKTGKEHLQNFDCSQMNVIKRAVIAEVGEIERKIEEFGFPGSAAMQLELSLKQKELTALEETLKVNNCI